MDKALRGRRAHATSERDLGPPPSEERLSAEAKQLFDAWLRFTRQVNAAYEATHGARRVSELRQSILIGLGLYNIYNLTSIVLLPDILWLTIFVRVCLVTPTALAIVWAVGRCRAIVRERLLLVGMLPSFAFPVLFFYLSQELTRLFTFGEFFLALAFANVLLCMRFIHASLFTTISVALTLVALGAMPEIDGGVRVAMGVQIVTAGLFTLIGNYIIERRRCLDFARIYLMERRSAVFEVERRKLLDLSRTDALTGLPNRRHLEHAATRASAQVGTVAVLMIDVDHFKAFNDLYGHPAGDECLRRVADVLEAGTRGLDGLCARYGGEEFAILVSGLDETEVVELAESLVRAVAGLNLSHTSRPDTPKTITVSIGVSFRKAAAGAGDPHFFDHADRALYAAKRQGRNRVAVAPPKPPRAACD